MEIEEHKIELEVLNIFKDILDSRVAIVYNI